MDRRLEIAARISIRNQLPSSRSLPTSSEAAYESSNSAAQQSRASTSCHEGLRICYGLAPHKAAMPGPKKVVALAAGA